MNDNIDLGQVITTSFIPEYLASNEDFLVFLRLAIAEFNISMENIKNFTDLVNPDKVPMKFIEALGSYTDFKRIVNADDEFNREVLMRVQSIYKERGTDEAIIMAATHGSNKGWVGGNIFVPGYEISKDRATLIIARDKIFTHSRSKHSGSDVFSDANVYRPGIIILDLPYIDDEIKEAINEVLPAGIKYKFVVNSTFIPSEGSDVGKFGELSFFKKFRIVPLTKDEQESKQSNINMALTLCVKIDPDNFQKMVHSSTYKGTRGKRSGRIVTMLSTERESNIGASLLPIDILKKDFLPDTPEQIEGYTYLGRLEDLLRGTSLYVEGVDSEDIKNTKIYIEGGIDIPFIPEETLKDIVFRRSTMSGKHSSIYLTCGKVKNVNDMTVDTEEYIISPTGEKLDVVSKKGSLHLHRDIDNHTVEIERRLDKRLTARRSTSSATRGKLGKMSGIIDNVVDCMAPIYDISPWDMLYDVSLVNDLRPSDYRDPFYSPSFEIESYQEEIEGYSYLGRLDELLDNVWLYVEDAGDNKTGKVFIEKV